MNLLFNFDFFAYILYATQLFQTECEQEYEIIYYETIVDNYTINDLRQIFYN